MAIVKVPTTDKGHDLSPNGHCKLRRHLHLLSIEGTLISQQFFITEERHKNSWALIVEGTHVEYSNFHIYLQARKKERGRGAGVRQRESVERDRER